MQIDTIGNLTKWQVDKIASWQNSKLTKCQVDQMASWPNGKLTKWQVGQMSSWHNVELKKEHTDMMTRWQHEKLINGNWQNANAMKWPSTHFKVKECVVSGCKLTSLGFSHQTLSTSQLQGGYSPGVKVLITELFNSMFWCDMKWYPMPMIQYQTSKVLSNHF